ncbi:MAG: histidine--tRNA ligase [Chlamydiae bacterium RIFCSPHIGHO2_12_FULL_49_9]|nr:MAG: histidine--tRNA ligase [Chlamydiae bacterium RIFCSPHIGHO2_12_FULL_49_9]
MEMQIPKGTFDILPYGVENWRLSSLWQYAEEIIRTVCFEYGFKEIRTPIYERTELFHRGVGDTSDIVTKEMFTFEDRGGRSISLRPEGTASAMRSFIENRLANLGSVHKFFYIGPMFRYERPQSGRYRQHHQFGVEAIGVKGPEQDAEIIDLLCQFYKRLGIQNFKVHINSVGDTESRANFRSALLEYLKPFFNELSADSRVRFEKNPLRILDSKDPEDKEIVKDAPSILDYLSNDAKTHFGSLCRLLEATHIPYQIDSKIVRGLDYYNKTVFEILTDDLGAQNTIGAGGRYDGLIPKFGGPDLPSVGFGTGLERVLQVLINQKGAPITEKKPLVYFIPMGEEAMQKCFELATKCRHEKIAAGIELNGKKIQIALQNGSQLGARFGAILGADEMAKGHIQLKNFETREQQEIPLNRLVSFLKEQSCDRFSSPC